MSNLILNTLKPAKETVVKFLGSMVDPIVGALVSIDDIPDSVALFDKVIVVIEDVNLRNSKIATRFIKKEQEQQS